MGVRAGNSLDLAPMPRRAILAARVLGVLLALGTMLPGMAGRFLVVDEPLEPADAIVVLGGGTPAREIEAARLYQEGWAPRIVLVQARTDLGEAKALEALAAAGFGHPSVWEQRRQTLLDLGVPDAAIERVGAAAEETLDELRIAARTLGEGASAILVSSSQHTRRVRLYWDYLTGGRLRARVHPVSGDGFDPDFWWRDGVARLAVLREYAGIGNYVLGFPVTYGPG